MEASATISTLVSEALANCRREQQAWARLPIGQRLRPVRKLRHLLVDELDTLTAAVAHDVGKVAVDTLSAEVLPLAEGCRFLEWEAGRLLRPRMVSPKLRPWLLLGQRDAVHRRPRGVVGIIGTWNYPLLLNGIQIAQALTAGNGVLWKPSEVAPASADVLFGIFQKAGFPDGLLALLPARRELGPELAAADVDHIVFTGAASTGRKLARSLGERLISSTLELSGCDAFFVLDDADVNLAARAAWFGLTLNRGQTCLAPRRALVHRAVYPAFVAALQHLSTQGKPVALAQESQVRHAERLIHAALAAGAWLLEGTGGRDLDAMSNRMEPAILLDARPDMAICREDSFAPLLAVIACEDMNHALSLDAQCPYALGASVFTANPSRVEWLAAQLRVGTVTVNDTIAPTIHPATPLGGRGSSGWGVTQGAEGLLELTVPQVVSITPWNFRPHYDLAAGKDAAPMGRLLRGLLESTHGGSWRQRWRGLTRMFTAYRKSNDEHPSNA